MIITPEIEAKRLYDKFNKQLKGPALNYALLHELTQNIAMDCTDEIIKSIQEDIDRAEAARIIPRDSITRLNVYRKVRSLIGEMK